jgi:hypothetical protein
MPKPKPKPDASPKTTDPPAPAARPKRRRALPLAAGGLLLAVAGLALLLVGPGRRLWRSPDAAGHNVLLITLDTTRADHLGCYGDGQARTPNIDSLAAEGVRFARVYAPAPLTLPSHN